MMLDVIQMIVIYAKVPIGILTQKNLQSRYGIRGQRMPEIYIRKNRFGSLEPDDKAGIEYVSKLNVGDIIKAKTNKPRNYEFHKKFFALIDLVFENQDKYETLEDLLVEIKLKVGHYKEHLTTKGQIIYLPKSISFAKMDEAEFSIFYEKVIDVILKYFIPVSRQDLELMINEFI